MDRVESKHAYTVLHFEVFSCNSPAQWSCYHQLFIFICKSTVLASGDCHVLAGGDCHVENKHAYVYLYAFTAHMYIYIIYVRIHDLTLICRK